MQQVQLSINQEEIIDKIVKWFFDINKRQFLTLGGFAGTGKTTLISYASNILRTKNRDLGIAFCSYTGKAVRVMGNKLEQNQTLRPGDNVSTIHQLIYEPIETSEHGVIGWKKKTIEEFKYGLIIVDEASMLNESIWNDLLSYNIPILAVGDHGQLPPIEGTFNLMENLDLKLETIFRQDADNPIITISKMARERGIIPAMEFGKGVVKMHRTNPDTQEFLRELFLNYDDDLLVLVGFNQTRIKLNTAIRGLIGFEGALPEVKDRVICLRNSYEKRIYNGMTGKIKSLELITDDWNKYYKSHIKLDETNNIFEGLISFNQFGAKETLHKEKSYDVDLFDYGYALTVHKSQGSQAKKVVVFEERSQYMDDTTWKKWLYTAVTRASEELYIIG